MPAGPPLVFLDTSAVFAAVWSAEGGARMILRLGEAGMVKPAAGPQVLAEAERAVGRKAPELLPLLALLLDRAGVRVGPPASAADRRRCGRLVAYPPDAGVLAEAIAAGADFFVTLDRGHFLDNSRLKTGAPLPVGSPGDFLAWLRGRLRQAPLEKSRPRP